MDEDSFLNSTKAFGLELEHHEGVYEENKLAFWGVSVLLMCTALIAILGNAMVLYVTYFNRNNGPLENLDIVIKSLALADMLLGLFGIPSRLLTTQYEGMYMEKLVSNTIVI